MRHKFIVIEGLDGTGKSTVCQFLAEHFQAQLRSSSSALPSDLRQSVDASGSLEVRFNLYRLGVSIVADEVTRTLARRAVVCDRWIYSTIAYHRALGADVRLADVQSLLDLPDHAFCLLAPDHERRRRMERRARMEAHDELFLDERLAEAVQRELLKAGCTPICTEGRSALKVVDQILEQVQVCSTTRPLKERPLWCQR